MNKEIEQSIENLILLYVKYHITNNYDYTILSSGVAIYFLQSIYKKSLKEGEAIPLSELPLIKIEQYSRLADMYETNLRNKEQVMMAAYSLDFITKKF